MKTNSLIWLCAMMFLWQAASAQIRLENSYNYSGTYTRLKNSGDKFFIMDVPASQCRIYNMDHSLWKTIHLPVPVNNYLLDIKFVSEGLFTDDDRLAMAYVYYSYNQTTEVYSYNAKVITESGVELLSIPGCLYLHVHNMQNAGYKLVAYSYDFSVWPETVKTHVYSLPGEETTKADFLHINQVSLAGAYPNPAKDYTIIPYELPAGVAEGKIILSDIRGNTIKTYRVDQHFDHLRVETSGLPAGVYMYTLITGETAVGSRKVVVR